MTVPVPAPTDAAARLAGAPDIAAFLSVWLEGGLLDGAAAETFRHYYGSFQRSFTGRTRRYYASQIAEAEALLRAQPGARVLEVGCGLGTESLWLALQGGDVTGIDLRADRVAGAQARLAVMQRLGHAQRCRFQFASVFDLPAGAQYDLIWMEQTFHHLEPREQIVRKIASLLAPGGHLVISEANAWNPALQLELLIRRGLPRVIQLTGDDGRAHPYGVERVTTAANLRRLFADAGVVCESIRHFRMFPNRPVFDRFSAFETAPGTAAILPLFLYYNYVGVRR